MENPKKQQSIIHHRLSVIERHKLNWRSLLEILRQRRVVPILAEGKPFDSQTMYAVSRQARAELAENTVIQEVVRGYLWGDRVLREAQVIVATQVVRDLER